jgi:hypothetical protein
MAAGPPSEPGRPGRSGEDRESAAGDGFSEGEWVAPLAAVDCGKAAFIGVIGASGMSPAEQVNAEIALRLQARTGVKN